MEEADPSDNVMNGIALEARAALSAMTAVICYMTDIVVITRFNCVW